MERRLAAILAADVVGYSRLMGVSEAATLGALKAHRQELVDGKIAEHAGRIVKLMGDGMLVEFPSVVNAVACSAEIQRGMLGRNENVPPHRRIEFRIGNNLGDVIVEGDDIFGDGVNVASRLEGIARPGGIAISATVLALVYLFTNRFEEAVTSSTLAIQANPRFSLSHAVLVASHANLGDIDAAQAAARRLLEIAPGLPPAASYGWNSRAGRLWNPSGKRCERRDYPSDSLIGFSFAPEV